MNHSAQHAGHIRIRYALQRGAFGLDVDAKLAMRGITGIFGPSGAGKTTLLRCIAGLERPQSGVLAVEDSVWQDSDNGIDLPPHKRDIGYVFQEPRLFSHLNVRHNLEYGLKRNKSRPSFEFDQIIDLLGLAGLLDRQPERLSGGEAQRVGIGRALLRSPRFILMDEPVAALDAARKDEVLPFIERLHASLDVPVLYVSHNIDEICLLCDQLLVMDAGESLAHGDLQSVLTQTDLPVLAGDEAGSVIQATSASYDSEYGLSEVAVSAGSLWVPGKYDPAAILRLRLRANDVSLCRERATQSSILNTLSATIERIQQESEYSVLVHLRAGSDRLISRVTRRSAAELNLVPDEKIIMQIKSVSVRHA
ncbi:MAG: molybdenum ABC transporter ATP-binding protein [Gammaproteobacteria bacterium]|nr:molybdenum ABC transporter ATP-binding protein [Gammaproteobacteria bacterium]